MDGTPARSPAVGTIIPNVGPLIDFYWLLCTASADWLYGFDQVYHEHDGGGSPTRIQPGRSSTDPYYGPFFLQGQKHEVCREVHCF